MSHTLQGWTLSLLCALSPNTDPIQQHHEFPHKPALDIFRSRCQQMSTPLHVHLKADPSLEGDIADDKADPSGSMHHQHVFRQARLSWKVLSIMFTLKTGHGGEWQVIWCFESHQIIHDVGSLCIYTMWLFNFFLLEIPLKQELPSCTTRLSWIFSSYLLFPSISSLSSSSSFISSPSSSFSPYFRRFDRPPGPPSFPGWTCRTCIGMSAYRPGLQLPQVSKYWQVWNYL